MLKVFYFNEIPNVGDQLAPYIIEKLSRHQVVYAPIPKKDSCARLLKYYIRELLSLRVKSIYPLFSQKKKVLLAIGSILSWGNEFCVYWGCGFMKKTDTFSGGQVLAVRGYCSKKKLENEYKIQCNVVGDPALLLPLVLKTAVNQCYEFGVIPHYSEYDQVSSEIRNKNVICMRSVDVEDVVNQIRSCKYILSSSLHGLIIAHAYGIPALWAHMSRVIVDPFKYEDYFSSVGIEYYSPIHINDDDLNEGKLDELFERYRQFSLPVFDIIELQRSLLAVAPFSIV